MDQNEEELKIAGSNPPPKARTDSPNAPEVPELKSSHADLSKMISSGDSNESIIDKLIATPKDQLFPWEETHVPSGGLYYGWPDGMCQVRPMGQVAEKILATQRLSASGESLDYLFRECCRFPDNFDPVNLLLGDRMFLLYVLRGISYGHMYEFMVKCPNPECEASSTHSYNLNELIRTVRLGNASLGAEPFRIKLPHLTSTIGREMWVGVRFLRAYDASDILARRKARTKALVKPGGVWAARQRGGADPRSQQREMAVLDTTLDENLEKLIVNVMGVDDKFKIREVIQRLHAKDTATIRDWLREHTPGIDSTIQIACPECSGTFVMELPITDSFFRPANR